MSGQMELRREGATAFGQSVPEGSQVAVDAATPEPARLRCRWCGTLGPCKDARFCATCGLPKRPLAYAVAASNAILKNLAIPLAITVTTLVLTDHQQESQRALSDREKLAAAYVDFGSAHSAYREASSEILFLASTPEQTVPSAELRAAVLKLDRAFDSVGAKLTPFEEYERLASAAAHTPDGKTAMEQTWQNCFLQPYFADTPHGASYWNVMTQQMKLCGATTCPVSAAVAIKRVLDRADTGTCQGGVPAKQRNFIWFWNELRRVMSEDRKNPS